MFGGHIDLDWSLGGDITVQSDTTMMLTLPPSIHNNGQWTGSSQQTEYLLMPLGQTNRGKWFKFIYLG